MDILQEALDMEWEGPLSAVADLPAMALYGVVLTFLHAAGPSILDRLREALAPYLGEPTGRRGLLRKRLVWAGGKLDMEASADRSRVEVRLGHRVKGGRLEDLVGHLAHVPGASDLRIRGHARRHRPAGSTAGPTLDG